MAKLLKTPNLNNAKIYYPTALPSNLSNPSFDDFFNANKTQFGISHSNNFRVSKAINTTATQSPNLTTGGFHFEPNYFSASKLLGTNDLWGIDIPVLIQKNQNAQAENLLIIIGQDPLRTTKIDPRTKTNYLTDLFTINNLKNSIQDYTIIGTPYAVTAHLNPRTKTPGTEPYPDSQVYYMLIEETLTLKKDYDVYLTDVIKYYPNNKKDPDISDLQLLAIEIIYLCNIYQSKNVVILAHGDKAISAVESCRELNKSNNLSEVEIIKTPHISGTANGAWSKWFNSNQSSPKYSELPNGFANRNASDDKKNAFDNKKIDCIISLVKEKRVIS